MIRAIIFDFDGVIVDSEPIHLQAWKEYFARERISIEESRLLGAVGLYDGEFIKAIFGNQISEERLRQIISGKFKIYHHLLSRDLRPFPGVVELVALLAGRFNLAIASSDWRDNIEMALSRLDIRRYFSVICAKEDVGKHKPHPEIYLKVASLLQLSTQDCLAVEDSVAGVEAAKAAGCLCLAVENSFPAKALSYADAVLKSLHPPERVLSLIERFGLSSG